MASWQDLPASDNVEWQQWLANDALDPEQGTGLIPQWPDSSTNYGTIQTASTDNIETASRPAWNHLVVGTQANHAFGAGAVQYRAPQAVQPWPINAGWRVPRQDDGFSNASNNADSGARQQDIVPRMPLLGFAHRQQPPGVSHPGAYPMWMGRDYGLDGFTHVANMGAVPVLRYHCPSRFQPPPLALQAPLPANDRAIPTLHEWIPYVSQYRSRASTMAQEPESRAHQFSGGIQGPGTYRELSITRPLVGVESLVGSYSFFATPATTPASLRASLPSPSTPIHARTVPSVTISTVGISALTTAPAARRSTESGGGHGRTRKFENYRPESELLPAGLSRQEICRNYPNHLHGEILLRVVYGQGDEQGTWKARKIWEECPADGRGNVSKYGRPHNYLEAAIRRAEQNASYDSQAVRQLDNRKRFQHEADSDDDGEGGQMSAPSKHARTTGGSNGNVEHSTQSALPRLLPHGDTSSRGLQDLQSRSDGPVNAGASQSTFQSGVWNDSVQNGEELVVNNIMPNKLSQRGHGPTQSVTASVLDRPRAMTLPILETNATIDSENRQPAVDAAAAAFREALRQECSYQLQLIRELNPDINKLSPEEQHGQVRKIWMAQYGRWEQKVKTVYNLELDSPFQDRANIFALLREIFKKVIADNAVEGEKEQETLVLKAAASIFSGCLRAIKEFRKYYVGIFAIQQNQTISALGASALPTAESDVAADGSSGSGPSIPVTTSPHSVETIESTSQNSNGLLISRKDTFEPGWVQQPRIDPAVPLPNAENEKFESVRVVQYRQPEEKGGPGPKKSPLEVAQEVEEAGKSDDPGLRPLEQVGQDERLDHLFEDNPNQVAGLANDPEFSNEVVDQAEMADPREKQDIARFEKESLAQQDHDNEPALASSTQVSNEAILGSVESAKERSAQRSASAIASNPAKRASKRNAHQAMRSTRNVAAATALPAPTPAELEVQAAFRAEMEDVAFRRAEELGANRAWIEMQTIIGTDGKEYRVGSHDVINWHKAYRASGQPVTENDAHAAVQWMRDGCPGVHSKFTENSKNRRQRENRERKEQRKRLQTERGGD